MLLQGFVLALFLTQSSQVSPPPPPATKGKGMFTGFASAAVGAVNSLVFDKVDIEHVFNSVFDEVHRKIGTESCIAGLYINDAPGEKTLKLINGKVSDLHLMSTRTKNIKEDASTITVNVTFSLPSLPLKYDFDYTSVRLITVERAGLVQLKHEGPVTVEFTVQLPKSQKVVDESKKSKKCVALIKSVKTTVNDKLTTVQVDYDSWAHSIGFTVTEDSVKEMLKNLRVDLKNNIEAAVQLLIEPVFRGNAFNCNDASYSAPTDPSVLKALDCRHVVIATHYKQKS